MDGADGGLLMVSLPIPAFAVEYFLLGRTQREAPERYTQDGGIVTDVWLAFAKEPKKSQRVLVAPTRGTSAIDLGFALHRAIAGYRSHGSGSAQRDRPNVSSLENFVAVTLYFDELLHVVLPLTNWWHLKNLSALRRTAERSASKADERLERAIKIKLGKGKEGDDVKLRHELGTYGTYPDRRFLEAAALAALIGVFCAFGKATVALRALQKIDPRQPDFRDAFARWVNAHAITIAKAARRELSKPFEPALLMLRAQLRLPPPEDKRHLDEPPELIQRVFLDRKASLADSEANCTIKADAAERVFDISCRSVTWAIIDSGIATTHPAFLDHDARDRRGEPIPPQKRVKATYDFTLIERIRNFDLVDNPEEIAEVADELNRLPPRTPNAAFRLQAVKNLNAIAKQLEQRIPPDWMLIEPLIQMGDNDDGAQLPSDHGTHVAGILGANWRGSRVGPDGRPEVRLRGVCPDIALFDLRVIHPKDLQSTEFAVLAALEFVQFLNSRAGASAPIVHGVNISLSIPHDVRNYGCGATPVCVACDRLVSSGVVVVAAAGNRGWNEQELGFGNFVFCSITDPGNAQEVITVGSTHRLRPHTFGVSYFSSRGPTGDGRIKPDLVAPGEHVRGPVRGETDDELDGTSMAAPFVSGAAAMLLSRHRELIGNPGRVKQILCASATDLGRERYFQGHGLVDVLRALQSV